jgi:hypothetical protein
MGGGGGVKISQELKRRATPAGSVVRRRDFRVEEEVIGGGEYGTHFLTVKYTDIKC